MERSFDFQFSSDIMQDIFNITYSGGETFKNLKVLLCVLLMCPDGFNINVKN